jgi:hypothetical protein
MSVKPSYLVLTGIGAIVAYSGLKGKGISSAAREVLTGNKPSAATAANKITPAVYAYGYGAAATAAAAGITPSQTSATSAQVAKNQAIARPLAIMYGWGSGAQWTALVNLWTRESGWNNYAYNAGSGATGIPQSLPYSKMPRAAWLPSQGGIASATAQIAWGLGYIKGTYGDPITAWAHEEADGWY